ncbi:MAG: DNA mismatch endonuclease Vsr [Hydrogenophilales bacterium]|jgi:DNA mismatch endonuclease (patch repair protein)|nr:DNA mismatch endonuclease Vsr [Hydrogenophilales bacterium]MBP8901357.1 DNA mismatch endonuclease Vsr [Thiobacillaceae bacterium]
MDNISPEARGRQMARVRAKDTRPEMAVRRLVFGMGYRYRLHDARLPGTPDLVFAGRGKVLFVHGCFWHRHENCELARLPKSRLDFWLPKLEGNQTRDRVNQRLLRKSGWRILVVWECELRDMPKLTRKIRRFLES